MLREHKEQGRTCSLLPGTEIGAAICIMRLDKASEEAVAAVCRGCSPPLGRTAPVFFHLELPSRTLALDGSIASAGSLLGAAQRTAAIRETT